MRYVCSSVALGVALLCIAPFVASAQDAGAGLAISKYTLIGEERFSRTQWYVTYRADLTNSGAARSGVTATVTSSATTVQVVPGQGIVHFASVPANGTVTSVDTFTVLVDRSVPFETSSLVWSFLNPLANAGFN